MLINCVAYQDGTKLADLPIEEISDYLELPGLFRLGRAARRGSRGPSLMQEEFGLHELAVEDAPHGHQRPKIEEYGNSLFVVMQMIEVVDGVLNVGEVDVFVGPNYVLSVRKNSEQGFMSVRERCESEPEHLQQGSGFVLYALMDAVVDRYFPIIDTLESELEAIEARIFSRGARRRAATSKRCIN